MSKRKKRLLRAVSLMIFTISVGIGATAAFFSDVIDKKMLIKSGCISFELPDGSLNNSGKDKDIAADLEEIDSKLSPLKKGDVFNYSFSTKYKGTVEAYIVPKLNIKLKNIKKGDKLSVYRKKSSGESLIGMIEFSGENQKIESYFLSPELVKEGETKRYDFLIKVDEICMSADAPPVMFIPEMDFAVTQKDGNEWISKNTTGNEEAFTEIQKENTGSESKIEGFTEIMGGNNTVNQNGDDISDIKMYFVKLKPVICEAEGDISEVKFYETFEGKDKLIESEKNQELWLCMNSSNVDTCIRYSVKNKAGRVYSPVFGFEEVNGNLNCFKKQ